MNYFVVHLVRPVLMVVILCSKESSTNIPNNERKNTQRPGKEQFNVSVAITSILFDFIFNILVIDCYC